jgi:acetyl-CoA hydrolase
MADTVAKLVEPGDVMVAGQVMGEPAALLTELFEDLADVDGLTLFSGMSLTGVVEQAPARMGLVSFVGMGVNGALIGEGRMALLPCHMSDLGWMFRDGPLRPDVALVLVSPPDSDGMCHLGLESDYLWPAVSSARVVLAEINDNVPRVGGDTGIPFERIDGYIRSCRPLPEYPLVAPSAKDTAIARRVSALVKDGSCLAIGLGRLGEAIWQAVADRRELGLHAGMVGDTALEMCAEGVISNARKRVDTGLLVAGSILGTHRAVALAAANPSVRLRSIAHTHSVEVVAQLDDFLCVNSAIEVDLLGQVNAESADGRYVGGIGGSVDFLRAAVRAPGGRSVVALSATAKKDAVSRIVPKVQQVTALRSDVDVVVTEYGLAELRGVSEGERARRLIGLAAPQFRSDLTAAARGLGL